MNYAAVNVINKRRRAKNAGNTEDKRQRINPPPEISPQKGAAAGTADDPVEGSSSSHSNSASGASAQSSASAMDIDPIDFQNDASTRSAGNNAGMSTTAGTRGVAQLPTGVRDPPSSGSRLFTKQYVIRIFNEQVEYRSFLSGGRPGLNLQGKSVRWPFHDIPVDLVQFFVNRDEMLWLKQFGKVTGGKASVKVYNRTAVIPFETNSTLTTVGNNNVGVHLCQIDPNVTNIRIGQLPEPAPLLETLQGKHIGELPANVNWSTELSTLGAQFVTRNYDHRFEYLADFSTIPNNIHDSVWPQARSEYRGNAFPIRDFIVKRENASFNEGLFTEWDYDYSDALIFARCDDAMPFGALTGGSATFGPGNRGTAKFNDTPSQIGTGIIGGRGPYNTQTKTMYVEDDRLYSSRFADVTIDNFPMLKFYSHPEHPKTVPGLIIGIDTLMSATTYAGAPAKVNTYIELTLDCSLEVHYSNSNELYRMNQANAQLRIPQRLNGIHDVPYYNNLRLVTDPREHNWAGCTTWGASIAMDTFQALEQEWLTLKSNKIYKSMLDEFEKKHPTQVEEYKKTHGCGKTETELKTLKENLKQTTGVLKACEGTFTQEQKDYIAKLGSRAHRDLNAMDRAKLCEEQKKTYNLN